MERFLQRLPRAELMHGGIVKLRGIDGYFNPAPMFYHDHWLEGRVPMREYQQLLR